MYNAVGIDVSKGKSTVTVLQPGSTVIRKPFDVSHTSQNLNELSRYLGSLDGDTRIVMECTGRYHEPILKALLFTFIIPNNRRNSTYFQKYRKRRSKFLRRSSERISTRTNEQKQKNK